MRFGNINLTHGLFLAPMAGVTDRAFRALCVEYGAECVTTELISAKAVTLGADKTLALASLGDDERPAGIQIFGSDPEIMARAACMLGSLSPDFIDINMGCPVHKLIRSGEGCALMRDPERAGEITAAVVRESSVPVTVKMRLGMTGDTVNAPEVAVCCEQAGASAVTVHGRTRDMFYSGVSDCEGIRRVKEKVSIPVVASGDIGIRFGVREALSLTGADGTAVGRAAMGAPWVFEALLAEYEGRPARAISDSEKLSVVMRHIDRLCEFGGERSLVQLRTHLAWYSHGCRGAAGVRRRLGTAVTRNDYESIAASIFSGDGVPGR